MKRSRALAYLAVGALAVVGVAGCTAQPTTTDKAEITFWYWPNSVDDAAVEATQKEFPNVKFTLLKSNDVVTKFQTSLAAGSGPDISMVGANIADYYEAQSKVLDYSTQQAYKDAADDFLPNLVKQATAPNGAVLGLPTASSTFAFYYKPAALEALGLPTEPDDVSALFADWDNYADAAAKAAQTNGGAQLICGDPQTVFAASQASFGGAFLSPDNKYIGDDKGSEESWQRVVDLKDSGACPPVALLSTDYTADLVSGKISGFIGYSWQAGLLSQTLPDESGQWRVASLPGGPAAVGSSYLVINKETKNPELATEIALFMMNEQNQVNAFNNIQSLPSSLAAFQNPDVNGGIEYYGDESVMPIFYDTLIDAPYVYTGAKHGEMSGLFNTAVLDLYTTDGDPDSLWETAQTGAKALMKDIK